jgi:ATP-dependent exoDNAse (exonuclease V) alpha subunit
MTQAEALQLLKMGYNVFLTGAAGSGKTYLLNQYIDFLRANKIPVGITASTGIAATHMGGTTIHSWTGMGIKESMAEPEIADLLKRHYLRNHFLRTRVLIIDEISMLHAQRLDLVHKICQAFKKIDYPFGGMQIIMCGDFFQLPPVSRGEESSDFVAKSEIWQEMDLKICYLDEQHRQDDRAFLRVLNDIRTGEVNEVTVEYLSERLNTEIKGFSLPTRLFTHNADVDAINKAHLQTLPGEEHTSMMTWRGSLGLTEALRKSCLAPEVLSLKVGAQVMFVKNNYDAGYVNGTLGEVIGFSDTEAPIVRTFDGAEITVGQAGWEIKDPSASSGQGEVLAAISQIPLRLAWAITVHKSQGMSLDAAEVDLSRSFVPGMGYVALSRVRSLTGLKLMGMNQMALQINPDVLELDRDFVKQSNEAVMYLESLPKGKKERMQNDFLAFLKGN